MRRWLLGYVVFAVFLAALVRSNVTSTSAESPTPVKLEPVTCANKPRPFDQISSLAATPAAPAPERAADGTAAPDDVVGEITQTVVQAVACANANDVLRSFALFTDRYLGERFGSDHPDDLGSFNASLSRTPVSAATDDELLLLSVDNVMIYDDVTASAMVITENRNGQLTDELVFTWVDGRWLIDAWTLLAETPAADEE